MSLKKRVLDRRVDQNIAGELKDKTVNVSRVAKVVKGGKRFSFAALVVTGDGRGHVGVGLGKAGEVPDAIRKASDRGRKALIRVPLRGTTIPHEIEATYGPTKVILKPAAPGTGVIAGSVVRSVIEAAGIRDIKTKTIGSSNPHNVLHAVFEGLLRLRDPQQVAAMRRMALEQLGYESKQG